MQVPVLLGIVQAYPNPASQARDPASIISDCKACLWVHDLAQVLLLFNKNGV